MTPPGDSGHYISSSWVPLDVGTHEMISRVHNCEVIRIDELKHAIHGPHSCQYNKLAGRTPKKIL